MIEIPLRNRGGGIIARALVDDADAEWVRQFRWHLSKKGYAIRNLPERGTTSLMARELLGLPIGDPRQADHRNRNRLDNRRLNLRIVTGAQNAQNCGANRGTNSLFRGVGFDRTYGKWKAYAQVEGRQRHLGYFETELDAAAASSSFRREHMPFSIEDGQLKEA